MGSILSLRTAMLGLLSWAIPFAVSFMFFGADGALLIPQPLFKSLMIVVFGALGAWLLTLAFRHAQPAVSSGLRLGLFWLAINLLLDLAILVPMTGMAVSDYAQDIGLRYLLIPIMAVAIGAVAQRARP